MIKEQTHILSNSAPCIDLIFTSQPNLVMHSDVHPSLHPNCHHQVFFSKFNLTIFFLHLTSNKPGTIIKQILILLNASTGVIKQAINYFTGKKVFLILTWINRFLLSVKRLWTSLKILFRKKQSVVMTKILPWWTNTLKHFLRKKKAVFKRLKRRILNSKLLDKLDALQAKLQRSIIFFSIWIL